MNIDCSHVDELRSTYTSRQRGSTLTSISIGNQEKESSMTGKGMEYSVDIDNTIASGTSKPGLHLLAAY